ncbi:unnamed protein product [Mytilus coruscus]|uniref:B box-type domain-containing protein n=1 Tax=Mytilus coruscus TaxID=42192 RepID=A0A6J7ZWI0_MYTCO|nr:unnamed protein product [Mytilus coruscus]
MNRGTSTINPPKQFFQLFQDHGKYLCGVCDNRQITKSSVVWCSECNEGLCGDCKEHHNNFKETKNHETVSIAEYKKLPNDVLKIAQICKIHNTKFDLFCRKHDCPADITTSVQKFGEVSVSSDPCDVSIQNQKDRQAQIMVALPTGNIDNLTLTLQKRIDTELSNIRGCSMLPDGRMEFSCYAKDIIRVLKSDGSTDFEIKKIGETFDVVLIGGESLAVTSSESDKINIIDLKNKILKKTIKVNSHNDRVAYKDGQLIIVPGRKDYR